MRDDRHNGNALLRLASACCIAAVVCGAAAQATDPPAVAATDATNTTPPIADAPLAEPVSTVVPSIEGNPAATDFEVGDGFAQKMLGIKPESGFHVGGIWIGNYNILMSGGSEPGASSWNSLLILSARLDAEKLLKWKGAEFATQFLQFNGSNTNGEAGSVQGYNSLPGAPPLDRSELYQLWYRQKLFDDRLIIRVGQVVPTFDFNNVTRPVSTDIANLEIPSVSGLLYTPIFVNPTLLGALPGYYNSAFGGTFTYAPAQDIYLSYGIFDGNGANGTQTGLIGPQFNGYYFNIFEAGVDWIIGDQYPGNFGIGAWYQTGSLSTQTSSGTISQDGVDGFYFFGTQRIWGSGDIAPKTSLDQRGTFHVDAPAPGLSQHSSASIFYQYGINNAETLLANQYVGVGITGFGLIPGRPSDSMGFGTALSWLNPNMYQASSELMFQAYYQALVTGNTFIQPTLTYIPTPGANAAAGSSSPLPAAWAFTLQVTVPF